MERITLKINL